MIKSQYQKEQTLLFNYWTLGDNDIEQEIMTLQSKPQIMSSKAHTALPTRETITYLLT